MPDQVEYRALSAIALASCVLQTVQFICSRAREARSIQSVMTAPSVLAHRWQKQVLTWLLSDVRCSAPLEYQVSVSVSVPVSDQGARHAAKNRHQRPSNFGPSALSLEFDHD